MEEGVEHVVGRETVLVGLAGAELGAGGLVDGVLRDDLALPVDPAGEGVDLRLEHIGDDREAAAHVAVERAVTDGHFALVAGGEEQGAEFVRERHHQDAADAGLDVFFGDIARPAGEERPERVFRRGDGVGDGDRFEADAEILGENAGVVTGVLRGNRGGQGDTDDVFLSQGVGGDDGDQRGINATGKRNQGALEAALVRVIAQAEDQGGVHVGHFSLVETGHEGAGLGCSGGVHNAELLGERGQAGDELAGGVAHEAAAVEDEFVVAADGVDVGDRAAERLGGVDDEFLTKVFLVVVPRAGRHVQHQVAFLRGELLERHLAAVEPAGADHRVRPDVLADRDADPHAVIHDDGGRGGGLEVAVLVKDVVGGQEALAGGGGNLAPVAEGGGVVERAALAGRVELDRADERRHVAHGSGDLGERLDDVGYEAALEQQVARRVATDGEFGKDHELGPLRDEGRVRFGDATAVAGEVANDRVKLG